MALNTSSIPLSPTLVIYFYQDQINYEVFCERLLELRNIMAKNKVKIDYYTVVMEEPSEDCEKQKSSGEAIYLYDYPADRLDSETLLEDIKKYMTTLELKHEK